MKLDRFLACALWTLVSCTPLVGVPGRSAAAGPSVKQATENMKLLTILVEANPSPDEQRCRSGRGEKVCVGQGSHKLYADTVAATLSRAGFRVVRDRLQPYDLSLYTYLGVRSSGERQEVDPVGGGPSYTDEIVYSYSVGLGSPGITTGLRKNDSGGWETSRKLAPAKFLALVDPSKTLFSRCGAPNNERYDFATTRNEGFRPEAIAAHVVNSLATCDALESFAIALTAPTPEAARTAVASAPPATSPPPSRPTPQAFRWPDVGTPADILAEGSNDSAIVVAIDKYTYLPPVQGALLNGADWVKFLVDGRKVPMDRIHFFRDATATREKLLASAAQSAKEVKPGGTLWFVFIGHGAPSQDGTDGVLVGGDAQQDPDSIAARSITQQELIRALSKDNSANRVLLLDACFRRRPKITDSMAITSVTGESHSSIRRGISAA